MSIKIYICILLSPLLLHASNIYRESCSYCHSNKSKLAKSYLQKDWYQLTQEHNTTLKDIHVKNLNVLAYFNSISYQPKELYSEMKPFASTTKVKKTQHIDPYRDSCRHCHSSKFTLAKHYSKEQWFSVVRDGTISKIHQKNLDLLSYLNSPAYSPAKLYSSMEHSAPEVAKPHSKVSKLHCISCHGSRINLSTLWIDKQWEALHDSLEPLREAHHRNLDALELIDSLEFRNNLAAFIEKMKFFAYDKAITKATITKPKPYSCLTCHDNHTKLAKLWSYKEWERLKETLEPLVTVHHDQLAVLEELKSREFQQALAKLLKKMQSIAANPQKHKIKEGLITFNYERDRATVDEAKILFKALKESLEDCKLHKPITFSLQIDHVDTSTTNTIISLMTIFIIPNRTTTTWSMKAQYGKQEFISYAKLDKDVGLLSIGSKEQLLRDNIKQFIDDLMTRMSIQCKK